MLLTKPVLFLGLALTASGQTYVPPATASGHWTAANSPYLVVDNVSIPAGQSLIIDPGVTVLVGSNLTVSGNGTLIQAIGTPSQRITVSSLSGSFLFNGICLTNSAGTNRFLYCDFANAQTAIALSVNAPGAVMPAEFLNCTFSNCAAQAIYGEAQTQGNCGGCPNPVNNIATLAPEIKNCVFFGTHNGCVMKIFGSVINCGCSIMGGPYVYGYGYCNATITANIFQGLTGTALQMLVGSYAGAGNAAFINNTVVDCGNGTVSTDPWDAKVQDNIFVGLTNACEVSGSLSRGVGYNDFYGNETNFVGYPSTYGSIIWNNRNGTPADALYNIFQNPLFAATNDFHLQTNSPCVNAGTPDNAFVNMCAPPSTSVTPFPEIGAFGGPDACNWLSVVPILPVQASMLLSSNLIWLNWGAIPRSTYQIQDLATNLGATFGTNKWLTNISVTPSQRPVFIAVSVVPTTNMMDFYRIQSLGRKPGN